MYIILTTQAEQCTWISEDLKGAIIGALLAFVLSEIAIFIKSLYGKVIVKTVFGNAIISKKMKMELHQK